MTSYSFQTFPCAPGMGEERSTNEYCARVYYQLTGPPGKTPPVPVVGSLSLRPFKFAMESGKMEESHKWMPSTRGWGSVCSFFKLLLTSSFMF